MLDQKKLKYKALLKMQINWPRIGKIASIVGIIGFIIPIISYGTLKLENYLNERISFDEVIVDDNQINQFMNGKFNDTKREIKIRYPQIDYILPNDFLEQINNEITYYSLNCITEDLLEYNLNYTEGLVLPNLLSLRVDQYYYYHMAANGNASIFTINIDPKTNRYIDFDIFDARKNSLEEIKKTIHQKINSSCGGFVEDKLYKASYIPRFFLKSESIVFVFSEYEITPGVCGSVDVEIYYKEVLRFIKHDGALGMLAPASGDWQASDHFVRGVMETYNELVKSK